MKKLLLAILMTMLLASCGGNGESPAPSPSPEANTPMATRMITATRDNPIKDNWTVLGEIGLMIDGEFADIYLATDAETDKGGEILWDDSQDWALVVAGENNNYVLFNENLYGKAYIDVATVDNLPEITLVTTSSIGISVKKYTYSDGAFYEESVIAPADNGNSIYGTFPDYMG